MMTPYAKLIVPLFQIMVLLLFLSPMASLPSTLPLYFFISLNDAKQPLNAIKKNAKQCHKHAKKPQRHASHTTPNPNKKIKIKKCSRNGKRTAGYGVSSQAITPANPSRIRSTPLAPTPFNLPSSPTCLTSSSISQSALTIISAFLAPTPLSRRI
jgi:hypothetical protein